MVQYDWLDNQPTNPPVPGTTPGRNTLQPVFPVAQNLTINYQPKNGDYVLNAQEFGGLSVIVTQIGSSFRANFQNEQTALEWIAWNLNSTDKTASIWVTLANGLLSPYTSQTV